MVSMKSKEADLTWEMKVMPVGDRLMGTAGEMTAGACDDELGSCTCD